jgi:hypothetical protein
MAIKNFINVAFHVDFDVVTGLDNLDPIVMGYEFFLFFDADFHTERGNKGTGVGFKGAGEEKVANLAADENVITIVLPVIEAWFMCRCGEIHFLEMAFNHFSPQGTGFRVSLDGVKDG